jgi:hypothetical protein
MNDELNLMEKYAIEAAQPVPIYRKSLMGQQTGK